MAGGARRINEVERRHYISQYDGAIAYLDAQIERLLERLKHLDALENTILIVTSDHGEAFGEHGHVAHGWSAYQEETRVPLVIKYPGQQTGSVSDANAGLVDLAPKVLAAAGLPMSAESHGVSLLAAKAAASLRSMFTEAYLSAGRILNDRAKYPLMTWAVISPERLKLISTSDGGQQLYDLKVDPAEASDLHHRRRLDSDRLLAELETWKQRHPLRTPPRRSLGQSTLERLRALGYLR